VGQSFHGTVVSLTSHGAVVEFYSAVRGFLPISEASEAYIADAKEHFRLGQTVKAWVLSAEETDERMRLSLKDQTYWLQGGQASFESLEEGTLITATVSAKLAESILIDIPSNGIVLRGVVNVEHLADVPGSKCEKKLAKIREGAKFKEVLVLSKNVQNRVVFCSMKPALIEAANVGALPSKYEDLYGGRKVTGWVKNVEDFGAFVAFAGPVEGVVHTKVTLFQYGFDSQDISDEPVTDPRAALKKGDVVTATVVKVDTQLQRSQLSLKSQVGVRTITADGRTEAIHPLDDSVEFIEDYTPGRLTLAKVIAVKQTQANVALAENLQGRIDVSEVVDSINSEESPLKSLQKGSLIQVRILGFHDAKTHRYLPLTHRTSNTQTIMELSCKPAHIKKDPLPLQTLDDIKAGAQYPAYINRYTGDYLWLNISPTIRGRMHILSLTDKVEKLQTLTSSYPIGSGISITVLGKTDDGKYLNFSARKNTIRSVKDVTVGSILPGRVSRVLHSGLMVQISEEVVGKVSLTDISDTYSAKVTGGYHENAIVRVCVLEVDSKTKRIELSMRASRVLSSSSKQTDREISSISDIKVGEVVRGFVANVADSGLFVGLSRNIVGRVLIRDLSDQFLKDWKSHFKVDQLVKGKVLSVDADAKKVGLTLKISVVEGTTPKGIEEISEGNRVTGVISRVEEYGVFVRIDGYNLSGLCHKSEVCISIWQR
jgi:rRNA biogenesis protein RRP5